MAQNDAGMSGLKPPQPLKIQPFDMSEVWKDFKQQFNWYSIATNLKAKPAEVQAAVLMTTIGPEAINIFNTFKLTEEESKSIDIILQKFEDHFAPKRNESFTRWNFFRLKQGTETFDEFLTEIKTKVQGCNFADLSDGLLRDKIVYGIRNDSVREKLLAEEDLTLEKAIQICKISEQASKQLEEFKNPKPEVDRVDRVNSKKNLEKCKQSGSARNNRGGFKNENFDCQRCGKKHGVKSCPAYNKRCRKCHKVGHFFNFCKSKNINVVDDLENKNFKRNSSDDCSNESESKLYLDAIHLNCKVYSVEDDWCETVKIGNKSLTVKLDTGAQCNVLSYNLAKELNVPIVKTKVKKLISFSNHELKVRGEINVTGKVKNKTVNLKFIVAEGNVKTVIGGETCLQLGLIKRILATENKIVPPDWKTKIYEGLGCLKDFEYDIDVDENVEFDVCPPRKIPYAIEKAVKAEIDRMVELDVIEPITEPSYCVSPLVIVKKDGKLRVCIDPSKLNKHVKRRHFPLRTIEEIAGRIQGAKCFALLDCKRGFWQIRVTRRTSKYLTVNTPWGRYAYKRIPFGLVSAPEIYQQKMSELLRDFESVDCSMDDILIYAENKCQLNEILDQVMKKLYSAGLRLNKDKCVMFAKEVKYLGHILNENGISPDPDKIKAIENIKTPTCVKELRRFIGLANYLGKFLPNFSKVTEPLRILLEKDVEWEWAEAQVNAFNTIKKLVSSAPVLGYYNVNDPVTVTVDASLSALGAVLSQNDKPIAYATKSLSKTQRNYPQIEKEALAMLFGCKKFHQYIYGKEVTIETDHKPLEIIGKKSITQGPPRLQRIFYDILQYNPKIVYKEGKSIPVADVLSRDCLETNSDKEDDIYVIHLVLPMSEDMLSNFKNQEEIDSELVELKKIIENGWPNEKSNVSANLQKYWNFRDELSVYDGLIFKGERIVVPKSLQHKVLNRLHEGHMGIQSSLRRARESFYWYMMSKDIEEMIKKCKVCQSTQPRKQKEPVLMKPIPEYPWQRVGSDLFQFNDNMYIVIADSYSGFYDFKKLRRATSWDCIKVLKRWFSVHGIPEVFESDNGSQYASREFRSFLKAWDITREPSSPYHAQSNGLAERAVQASKTVLERCLRDNSDVALALLNIRNTPRENNLMSINQRLLSRTTRSLLPSTKKALMPKVVENASALLEAARMKKTEFANRHTKNHSYTLSPGDHVRVQTDHKNWIGGEIESMVNPRSAIIKSGDKRWRRNTIQIEPTTADLPVSQKCVTDFKSTEPTTEVHSSPPPPSASNIPNNDCKPKTVQTRSGRIVRPPNRLDL